MVLPSPPRRQLPRVRADADALPPRPPTAAGGRLSPTSKWRPISTALPMISRMTQAGGGRRGDRSHSEDEQLTLLGANPSAVAIRRDRTPRSLVSSGETLPVWIKGSEEWLQL